MLEYIYFVKCPGCEDEHFSFFSEAKEFALGRLSQKPIITQIEVNRNDFGECVDSCDLGTVWSWEDMMKDTDAEPACSIFTKDDLVKFTPESDPEFDTLDNSVDFVPDTTIKAIPEGMTVEAFVEEMEENEDTVECKWCEELFDKSECRYEVDLGWLCDRCQQAIMSRGESLTFREGPLDEAVTNRNDEVTFKYSDLDVTLQGPKRTADDWEESEDTVYFTYTKNINEVATDLWDFLTDEDAKDVPGGLETLVDNNEWEKFLETHFDDLLDKYYNKLLDYYRDDARKEYEETHSLEEAATKESNEVAFEYDDLEVTLLGQQRDVDDWDEETHIINFTYVKDKDDVTTDIWENFITEEDVTDVPGGLTALEDDTAWEAFLETHWDTLLEKYYNKLLEYYREAAATAYEENTSLEYYYADVDARYADDQYDAWRDEQLFDESCQKKSSMLEELEDSDTYRERLSTCPECGTASYDKETGFCIDCGFNI